MPLLSPPFTCCQCHPIWIISCGAHSCLAVSMWSYSETSMNFKFPSHHKLNKRTILFNTAKRCMQMQLQSVQTLQDHHKAWQTYSYLGQHLEHDPAKSLYGWLYNKQCCANQKTQTYEPWLCHPEFLPGPMEWLHSHSSHLITVSAVHGTMWY